MINKDCITLFGHSMHIGGIERSILNLSKGFLNLGYDVDLLLVRDEGPLLNELPDAITVIGVGQGRFEMRKNTFDYIRNEKPNAIIAITGGYVPLLANLVANRQTEVYPCETSVKEIGDSLKQRLKRNVMEKWLYKISPGIITVSNGLASDLSDLYTIPRDKIKTINNPVDIYEIRHLKDRPIDHSFQNSDSPLIVSVGRFHEVKDYPTLIRAFVNLRSRRDANLLLVGEGDEENHLRELIQHYDIKDSVDILGFANNPYPYMAAGSVFVLPSKKEGFGNVLIEALACGTPVVSTDCPHGPSEILDNGEYGSLVPVGDAAAMANAIESTIDNPPSRNKLTSRAADFSLERIAREYESLIFNQQ